MEITTDGAQQVIELLAEAYERAARAFEHSATLAESHARRHGLAGQGDAAEDEYVTAGRARKAAQRAREAAEHARETAHGYGPDHERGRLA